MQKCSLSCLLAPHPNCNSSFITRVASLTVEGVAGKEGLCQLWAAVVLAGRLRGGVKRALIYKLEFWSLIVKWQMGTLAIERFLFVGAEEIFIWVQTESPIGHCQRIVVFYNYLNPGRHYKSCKRIVSSVAPFSSVRLSQDITICTTKVFVFVAATATTTSTTTKKRKRLFPTPSWENKLKQRNSISGECKQT